MSVRDGKYNILTVDTRRCTIRLVNYVLKMKKNPKDHHPLTKLYSVHNKCKLRFWTQLFGK